MGLTVIQKHTCIANVTKTPEIIVNFEHNEELNHTESGECSKLEIGIKPAHAN